MNVNGRGITARLSRVIQPDRSRSCHLLTVAAIEIQARAIKGKKRRKEGFDALRES